MNILSIKETEQAIQQGATIIDTRPAEEFIRGFIPQSLYLGPPEKWAIWAKKFIAPESAILVVCVPGREAETEKLLQAAGLKNLLGYVAGGVITWVNEGHVIDMIIDIDADELLMDLPHDKKLEIIDVRQPEDYDQVHVQGATNIPLQEMADVAQIAGIDEEHNLYVHCGGGSRAIIAAALLKKEGYAKIRIVNGGFKAISEVPGMPTVEGNIKLG